MNISFHELYYDHACLPTISISLKLPLANESLIHSLTGYQKGKGFDSLLTLLNFSHLQPAYYLFSSPTGSTSSDNIMSSAEKPGSTKGSSTSSIKMLLPDVSPFGKEHAVMPKPVPKPVPKPIPVQVIDIAESPAHRPRQLLQTPSPPSKSAETAGVRQIMGIAPLPDPKQRLDEITAAVKPFLRPYFKDGKISKDAYKDVLGKAVKDLYRECGKERGKIPTAKACDIVQKHVNAVRRTREAAKPSSSTSSSYSSQMTSSASAKVLQLPRSSSSTSSSTSSSSSQALSKSQESKVTGTRLEEITDAVKPFLRPYYRDGKIDKDAYKDMLSRAVKSLYQEFGREKGQIPTSRACDTVQRLFKRSAH